MFNKIVYFVHLWSVINFNVFMLPVYGALLFFLTIAMLFNALRAVFLTVFSGSPGRTVAVVAARRVKTASLKTRRWSAMVVGLLIKFSKKTITKSTKISPKIMKNMNFS